MIILILWRIGQNVIFMSVAVYLTRSDLFLLLWQQLSLSSLSHLRYDDQSLTTITYQCSVLALTKTFTSSNILVKQWFFHHYRHQDIVLTLFLFLSLYYKNNSTRILILLQQSLTPLVKLLFILSTIIEILSVKLEHHGQLSTLDFHWYWERQTCVLLPTDICCSRSKKYDGIHHSVVK